MASTSGPARHRKTGSSGPAGRVLVPAIPLPHVKRQAAAAANRSANAKVNRPDAPVAPQVTAMNKSQVNGKETESRPEASKRTEPAPSPSAKPRPANAKRDKSKMASTDKQLSSEGPMADASTPIGQARPVQVAAEQFDSSVPAHTNGVSNTEAYTNGELQATDSLNGSTASPTSENHQPTRSTTFDTRPQSIAESEEPSSATMNGRYRLQQSHLSNNNLHFGAADGSEIASPPPTITSHFGPPPVYPASLGQLQQAPGVVNGDTTNAIPTRNGVSGPLFDSYGRPTMAFSANDGAQPYGNGPTSTHQSIHDSVSSIQHEDAPSFQQQNSLPQPRGINLEAGPSRSFHDPMARPLNYPPPMLHASSLPMNYPGTPSLGLTAFIQQAWLNTQYVDCLLEIRDRIGNVDRFPAHHVVLAQSPVLSSLLIEQGQQPLPFSSTPHPPLTLFLQTDNKWYWSDSLKTIMHTLYGFPFPNSNPNPQGPLHDLDAPFFIGPSSRCLSVSLSYAAGGHILGMNQIVTHGAELAARHLEPRTIDTALAFALDGHQDKGTHEHFQYGDGSKIILQAIIAFVASHLLPTFQLDVSVTSDGFEYARLPHDLACPGQTSVSVKSNTSGHRAKGSNAQKSLNIQFGDLSLSGQGQEEKNGFDATLSRLLLNLPFSSLKFLAEFGPPATAECRVRAVHMAVQEREARRLRALDAVTSGEIPNAEAIRENLQSPEPSQYSHWSILGWREELTDTVDGPSLSRQWQPLRPATKSYAAEYP